MMGSGNMSLLGWRVLVDYSIEHACLSPEARVEITRDFEERWTKFCQWIIDTYGAKQT
jgi:adenosine deaminase CECR1